MPGLDFSTEIRIFVQTKIIHGQTVKPYNNAFFAVIENVQGKFGSEARLGIPGGANPDSVSGIEQIVILRKGFGSRAGYVAQSISEFFRDILGSVHDWS